MAGPTNRGGLGTALSGLSGGGNSFFSGLGDMFSGIDLGSITSGLGDMFKSDGFDNALGLGSLALQGYGLNKSLGIADEQLGILQDQENRAATAQNLQTNNQLSLAAQMTTPGTAEHEMVANAIASGQYQV